MATGHITRIFLKSMSLNVWKFYFVTENGLGWSAIRLQKLANTDAVSCVNICHPFLHFNIFLILLFVAIMIKSSALAIVALAGWLSGWLYFHGQSFYECVVKRDARWFNLFVDKGIY